MPNDRSSVAKLSKCIRDCNGNEACMKACEDAFVADGGKVTTPDEGGKVFTDSKGGKVFITTGGKVF
jgi:hypothetical protein